MRTIIFLLCFACAAGAWAAAAATSDKDTGGDATAASTPAYTEREEKVVNFVTGKTETERVIEFAALEILPEVSRPVTIIIPRHKPDFNEITLTVFNNEPSLLLPDVYRLDYYRRLPLPKEVSGDDMKAEGFTGKDEAREAAARGAAQPADDK